MIASQRQQMEQIQNQKEKMQQVEEFKRKGIELIDIATITPEERAALAEIAYDD